MITKMQLCVSFFAAASFALPSARAGEVHTRNTAGTWAASGGAMHGSIPDDTGFSFFMLPEEVSLGSPVMITARVRFINPVDYGGAGVALIDPQATNAMSKNLRIELSERDDTVGFGGWLEKQEGSFPGAGRKAGRDIKLGEWYELGLKIDGIRVTGYLDGVEIGTAEAPEIRSLPQTLRLAAFVIEADAEIKVTGGNAAPPPPVPSASAGVRVLVEPYGKDETDGSEVGWNARGLRPSFDDDPGRRGSPNAAWDGSFEVRPGELCLRVTNLRAPFPPVHTVALGYTVTLDGAAFAGGLHTKTIVLHRFTGSPEKTEFEHCEAIR